MCLQDVLNILHKNFYRIEDERLRKILEKNFADLHYRCKNRIEKKIKNSINIIDQAKDNKEFSEELLYLQIHLGDCIILIQDILDFLISLNNVLHENNTKKK